LYAFAMLENPQLPVAVYAAAVSEQAMMTRFVQIGIGPGRTFDLAALDDGTRRELDAGVGDAKAALKERLDKMFTSSGMLAADRNLAATTSWRGTWAPRRGSTAIRTSRRGTEVTSGTARSRLGCTSPPITSLPEPRWQGAEPAEITQACLMPPSAIGWEYLVDAHGCDRERLCSLDVLQSLVGELVKDLNLKPVTEPLWHRFPSPGGVTGLILLQESHIALHTFPETGFAALSVYCCKREVDWPWNERLTDRLGATGVTVRTCKRPLAG
jgi:S-adenosylmethionine decarboxylase